MDHVGQVCAAGTSPRSQDDFLPFDAASAGPLPGRASRLGAGPELGMGALMRFKSMMAVEGEPVQMARMCYDRLYAYERIATAHATGGDGLRRLALELFQIYHRREAGAAVQ